ncbi:MAG: hypothetical protein ABSG53_31205 [Thermoguttaceae bacterium]
MAFRFKLAFLFVVGWAAAASGQRTITLNPVQVAGAIIQLGPGKIAVKAANGQNWILNLRGNTKVKITGSAEPEMLTPGTCVRFTASIDKRSCKGQEKIDQITIFTQTPGVAERTLGVERASALPQGNEEGNAAGPPGSPPLAGGPGANAGKAHGPAPADAEIAEEGAANPKATKRRGPGAKGPDKSVPDVAAYDVCAEVVSFRGGRLIVSVQNRFFKPKITVELAADAKIGLDLGNLSIAKPGDKISAEGYYITPGTCEVVTSVEIALTNTLAPPGSRAHHARPAAHGSDAARRAGGKAKAGEEAAAGKKNAAAADEKALVKKPAEVEPPDKNLPPEKDKPPAKEPEAKPNRVPNSVMPPSKETKPEPKKPPVKDDEKDVFEK